MKLVHVPYKGSAPAMTDLLGGQVDLMCDQTTNTTGQIESGKVKAFAVTTSKPLTAPALAKLPTLESQGLKGFNVSIWHGLYAPKGTPKPILDSMNAALKKSLQDQAFVRSMESLGAVIRPLVLTIQTEVLQPTVFEPASSQRRWEVTGRADRRMGTRS